MLACLPFCWQPVTSLNLRLELEAKRAVITAHKPVSEACQLSDCGNCKSGQSWPTKDLQVRNRTRKEVEEAHTASLQLPNRLAYLWIFKLIFKRTSKFS